MLTDSNRLHQGKEGTTYFLVVDNAVSEDGGVYTCVAKNAGGEVLCKAELIIHEGNVTLAAAGVASIAIAICTLLQSSSGTHMVSALYSCVAFVYYQYGRIQCKSK